MKNPLLYRSARPESDREVRKRFLVALLARTQSERRRRLALASGFRLSDCLGVQYSHYSLLATVEAIFNLGTLGRNDTSATPMSDLFRGGIP
jgi:hypothetical protein